MNIPGNQTAGDLPVYPSATSGKYRTVTIMFVDVVDSTRIFENIDPEYVHQIMVGCFDILLDEVHKNQGSINQFRGDSIMALFAATASHDNHALCACQAALGVISAIKAYNQDVHSTYRIPFQVRIGVHTGPVTIGTVGAQLQGDFVADCNTTRLASLLESRAHPGTILVSDNTAKRVDSYFNLRLPNRINNKIGDRSIRGFELTDVKASGHIPYPGTTGPLQPYTPRHLADRILTTRSSIEGERKYITVMFVGIADNADVFKNRAAELVNRITDNCFQILRNQIYSFGGVINQYRGDCVMALFGAPVAYEDHAARACHAALSIMRAIQAYRLELEKECSIPLALRIGLNTGQVVAGSIGNEARMDYTADGDTSNLAARLCARADPGAILVSSNTFQRIRQLFRLNSLGSTSVKGRKKTITVYTLLGESLYRPRLGQERLIYSAMVGRDRELKTLKGRVQKLLDGTGAVVNIIGEAGIGKSRLVAELLNLDIINQAMLLEGKAISIGSGLSYYPLIDLLKNWVGIIREDDQGAAFDKLEAAVLELHSAQGSDIIPFIATLMGMELSGQYARRVEGITGEALENLIFKNLRELILLLSRRSPLIVIMEDLHWADLSSIGLLQSLFLLAQSHPVLFINPLRPGYEQTTEALIKALKEDKKDYYQELSLTSLDSVSSEALIYNMLRIEGLPGPLISQIVRRADGNPYFIEEVVRSFLDEGVLVASQGRFVSTDKIHDVVIPETIADLLSARIDRLEESDRQLIKTASVIGRNFFYRILKEVEDSYRDIDQRLAYLQDIQMIFESQRLQEIEYLFTHALAQEAAYESILLERRKALHLKVARSVEELFGDNLHDFYGLLSFHYSKAESFHKAEEYLLKSGEEALKASASSEAVMFFKEGLRLYQNRLGRDADPAQIAYLHRCIAIAYYNKGRLVESIPFFNRALEHYGVKELKNVFVGTIKAVFGFFMFVLRLYLPVFRKNKSATEIDNIIFDLWFKKSTALAVSSKAAFFRETIRFNSIILNYNLRSIENGVSFLFSGSVLFSYGGLSFTLANRIMKIARVDLSKENTKDLILYCVAKQLIAFLSGAFKEEAFFDEKLVEKNLEIGETVFTTFYINQFIFQNIEKGNFKKTTNLIALENEIIEQYRCDFSLALLLYLQARLLLKMRCLPEAMKMAEQGIAQADRTGDVTLLSQIYSIMARMHIVAGDLEIAEKFLLDAEKIKLEAMLPFYLVEIHLSRFMLDVRKLQKTQNHSTILQKKGKEALQSGKKAAKVTKRARYNSVELYRYMGLYYWQTHKRNKAFKYWGRSIENGRAMGARPELARTYLEVGRHLLDEKGEKKTFSGLGAEDYLDMARKLFEDMDLTWDLGQLELSLIRPV